MATGDYEWKKSESPFLYLTAELPPPPLFKDEVQENIIPQVSLYTVLSKFNGETEKEVGRNSKERILKIVPLDQLILKNRVPFVKSACF